VIVVDGTSSRTGWSNGSAFLRLRISAWLCLGAMFVATCVRAGNGPVRLDFVATPSGSFSNVSVVSMTDTHVTVKGADGSVATLRLADLDAATLARLKGQRPPPETTPTNALTLTGPRENAAPPSEEGSRTNRAHLQVDRARAAAAELLERISPSRLGLTFLLVVFGVFLAMWLFYCYCLMLICRKTGNDPGFLIWLPLLQLFPMFRAASMSYWWFLVYLLIAPVAYIVWCFKIAEARGKSALVAILLILPITNLFAFLYLAFSAGVDPETITSAPPPGPIS
jgi:hypothetical protein